MYYNVNFGEIDDVRYDDTVGRKGGRKEHWIRMDGVFSTDERIPLMVWVLLIAVFIQSSLQYLVGKLRGDGETLRIENLGLNT